MPQEIPPIIEPPKTLIGVGLRELVLLAVFVLLAISVFLLPLSIVLKAGLAVLVAGCGTAIAFGRDPRSGKTLESYLKDRFQYAGRARFFQRGAGRMDAKPFPAEPVLAQTPSKSSGLQFARVTPLPLGMGMCLAVMSLSVLAALLTWVWVGGVAEISLWFAPRVW